MKLQCLIDRQGPTSVMYNGVRFDFVPNEHEDYVCDVANPGAVSFFLETFAGQYYREYIEPAPRVIEKLVAPEGALTAAHLTMATIDAGVDDEHLNGDVAPALGEDLETGDGVDPMGKYSGITDKDHLVAVVLADTGHTLSKKYSLENMKLQLADIIKDQAIED